MREEGKGGRGKEDGIEVGEEGGRLDERSVMRVGRCDDGVKII
jgi:hypothetical protein